MTKGVGLIYSGLAYLLCIGKRGDRKGEENKSDIEQAKIRTTKMYKLCYCIEDTAFCTVVSSFSLPCLTIPCHLCILKNIIIYLSPVSEGDEH